MDTVAADKIRRFLTTLGEHWSQPATLFLLGGSALCLLGSSRPTLDIDYVGDDVKPDDFQQAMAHIAAEMQIEVEPVSIAQFVPLPVDAQQRCIFVGQFGALSVYVFDPYTIALSKLDRGFDTDIEDIVFLIEHGFVQFDRLQALALAALERANEFDLAPQAVRAHLKVVQNQL